MDWGLSWLIWIHEIKQNTAMDYWIMKWYQSWWQQKLTEKTKNKKISQNWKKNERVHSVFHKCLLTNQNTINRRCVCVCVRVNMNILRKKKYLAFSETYRVKKEILLVLRHVFLFVSLAHNRWEQKKKLNQEFRFIGKNKKHEGNTHRSRLVYYYFYH